MLASASIEQLTTPTPRNIEMKLYPVVSLALATVCAATQMVNRSLTNGWGSTPAQRHYVDQAQALTAINAGIQRANAIK